MLPHPKFGYRGQIQAYRVKREIIVGTGKVLSQDLAKFGSGGGTQFFLSNYKAVLEPVGNTFSMGI